MPIIYGYARVSKSSQSIDLQVEALEKSGILHKHIYCDEGLSGVLDSRPQFDTLMDRLGGGDTIRAWKLDRMGRSLKHLLELYEILSLKKAHFDFITERFDTSSAMGRFVLQVMSAVAELEREMIRERTLAGLEIAAKAGRVPGRPKLLTDGQLLLAHDAIHAQNIHIKDVAYSLDVSPETLRRNFKQMEVLAHG